MRAVVLALRFLLEVCALVGLGFWGFRAGTGTGDKVALGVFSPLLAALVWGLFVSPRRRVQVSEPVRWAIELAFFGLAAAALWAAGERTFAVVFGALAVVDGALVRVWKA